MGTKKENKKGFWASLFSSKPCSCGDNLMIEYAGKPAASCCGEDKAATTKTDMKEVCILGPGCAKCKATYQVVEKVINENNLAVKLTKIEDIIEIMSYNVMGTPAVVVDGIVKIKGHVPSESEIKQILGI